MNSIWSDFARMIYNVEVEVQGPDGEPEAPPEWAGPRRRRAPGIGALAYSGGTIDDQPTAYGDAG